MSLTTSNYYIAQGRPPLNPPAHATYTARVTGGVPGYTYSSSNTNVATIDANGKVRASGNGTATLSVTDSKNHTASHNVYVSGATVFVQKSHWGLMQYAETSAPQHEVRGIQPTRAEIWALQNTYVPEGRPDLVLGWLHNQTWTGEFHPVRNYYWAVAFESPGNQAQAHYSTRSAVIMHLL